MTKVSPKKEYKSFGVEWLADIPEEWEVKPLWSVSQNKSIKSSNGEMLSVYLDRGVIRASQGDLGTHAASLDLSNYQKVEPGDFVLNNQQAWRGSVGVSFESGIISPAYIILRLSNEIEWRFANYLLRAKFITDQFMLVSRGVGSIQRQVHAPSLRNVLIFIPPLNEQKSIADFLDEKTKIIDGLIENKEKLIELLREKRAALITRALTKGLNPNAKLKPSGIDWLGDIPKGWETKPLKSLFVYQTGGAWGDEERFDENDIVCIRVADFDFLGFITYSDEYTRRNFPEVKKHLLLTEQSILLEKSGGGDQSPVGRAVRYTENERAICSNFIQKLEVDGKFDPEFVVYLLAALYFLGVTKKAIKQTTGIQNLDLGYFFRTPVFYPQINEQKRIAKYIDVELSKIVDVLKKIESQIEKLKEYRSSLIYNAVTGKIKI